MGTGAGRESSEGGGEKGGAVGGGIWYNSVFSFLPSLFVIDTNCTLFAASFVASSTSSPSISAVCAADDAAAALATCFAMDCADWIRIMLSGFTATVFPPSSAYRRAERDANEEGGGDDRCICTIGHVG